MIGSRVRSLKARTRHLREAASHTMRLEAIAHSVSARSTASVDRAGGRSQGHPRNIFAVTDDKQDQGDNADLLQCIAQLEKQLKQATKGSKNAQGSSKKSNSKGTSGQKSTGQGESASVMQIALVPKLCGYIGYSEN